MRNIEQSIILKKELDTLRPLKKEDELRIMQKFRLDWNYHSNNLEGNTLTYGETKALILFGITAQGKPLKDHFEITGHDEAIKWLLDIVEQKRPLTENFIRELHQLILKESYEEDAITPDGQPTKKTVNVGVYKKTPNHVKTKTGEIFYFATPEETPAKMKDLVDWYRLQLKQKELNPILLAAEFHYKYIRIHPFDDGNGRTARILMNFILMQFGFPPVIIKTQDKENYFAALRQADAGIFEPFVEYIAENLNHSLEIMIKGAKGKSIEEPDDLEKEIALLGEKLNLRKDNKTLVKTTDRVAEIFNDSIIVLIKKFIEKGKLFEKFYLKSGPKISINGGDADGLIENILYSDNTELKGNIDTVWLAYYYEALDQKGLENVSFFAKIVFNFDFLRYKVSTPGFVCEKSYGSQLTTDEISNLVTTNTRRHKEFIEARIEEIQKK